MKTIKLTQNRMAFVDDRDYEELNKHKWYALRSHNTYYVRRATSRNPQRIIFMHRVILNAPEGQDVDHRNGDGLDNRRSNLRFCSPSQNHQNQKPQVGRTSLFKGVNWYKARKKWMSQIRINGNKTYLGLFENEIEAARAYDRAAKKHFGEFARPNF